MNVSDTASPIVSVIMPAFNSERHIAESVASVQAQTMGSWELLIVDDCSTDKTSEIVKKLSESDSRIRLISQSENGGAAVARNTALDNARGRYIAYLDADDLWLPEKIEKQTACMDRENAGFSCASYEVIDEEGSPLGRTVHMPPNTSYWGYLTNNYLQTVGIMADLERVDKSLLVMPDMRRRQDAATWLQVLAAGHDCIGVNEVLCQYRRTSGSLSSNKVKAVRGTWYFYRQIAKLPMYKAIYCFVRYAFLAVWKRTYPEKRGNNGK